VSQALSSLAPGEAVVVQEVWRNHVWAARPMTLVQDEIDRVVLWFPTGTIWKRPVTPATRSRDADRGARHASLLTRGDWIFVDAEWDVSTLVLMEAGAWHAVWVSWLDDGTQWGWYVNLQRPFRRTELGFETMDLVLDVLIENDRTWRWKDEGELATFVATGVFEEPLAKRLRVEGLRVARRAERNEAPFDEDWAVWRPNDGLLPELPRGWAAVCR
jgi:hypothetical protein